MLAPKPISLLLYRLCYDPEGIKKRMESEHWFWGTNVDQHIIRASDELDSENVFWYSVDELREEMNQLSQFLAEVQNANAFRKHLEEKESVQNPDLPRSRAMLSG